jgi:hypothetical protein
VLLPDDIDEKYGLTSKAVLHSKHPETTTSHKSTIHQYESIPDFIKVDITQETVHQVARNLSGSAGLGGWTHGQCPIGCWRSVTLARFYAIRSLILPTG